MLSAPVDGCKLKRLLLPACVPKLVYNSILSWVAGWYYLIACEIITVGPAHYRLPGLGSYLMEAAEKGRTAELIAGMATLLAIIILMDLIVWQPLSTWAEKFRYEFAASSTEAARSLGGLDALGAVGPAITRGIRAMIVPVANAIHWALRATPPFNPAEYRALFRVGKAVADCGDGRDPVFVRLRGDVGPGGVGPHAAAAVAVAGQANSGSHGSYRCCG